MLDKVMRKIGLKEPVELESIGEAENVFRERRKRKLQKLDERKQELKKRSEEVVERIKEDIKELEGFEDRKDRNVVDDVMENIVEDRMELLENFDSTEEVEQLQKELREFLEDFEEVKDKEAAVLDEINREKVLLNAAENARNVLSDINNFVKNDYRTEKRLERISDALEEIKSIEKKLKQDSENGKVEELEEKLEDTREELEELEASDKMAERHEMEERLSRVRQKKKDVEKQLGVAMGKTERGLKKLLYEGGIGKASRHESEILKSIRDRKKEKILDYEPGEVEKAAEAVMKSDNSLEQKTQKKLVEGLKLFSDFKKYREKREKLENDIEQLEEKVENHEAAVEEHRLENKKERLKRRLEKEREKVEETRQEIESMKQRIQDRKQEILNAMEEEFSEVKLEN